MAAEVRARRGLDRRARREYRHRLTAGRVMRWAAGVVAMAAVILWVAGTYLVQGFAIPSTSMAGTLQAGDRVLVSKLAPAVTDLDRGDVVVFTDPGGWLDGDDRSHVVKRVIGLPGDHVTANGVGGAVTINGVPLDESYLDPGTAPSEVAFDVVVPEGKLFVLGDNRSGSSDSRFRQGTAGEGFVPLDDVVGRVMTVYWPLGRAGMLSDLEPVSAPFSASTAAEK